MRYIGIDPGMTGSIVTLDSDGHVLRATPMPSTETDILLELGAACCDELASGGKHVHAFIEGVHAFPKMGAVSAFTFGRGYGGLLMALSARYVPFDIITPQKWQAVMQCRTGGDKNVSKRRAQQLFPGIKVTHAIADGLLIAEFCRRSRERGQGEEAATSQGVGDGASGIRQGEISRKSRAAKVRSGEIQGTAASGRDRSA